MQTNVLEYLENIVDKVPDKVAYADEKDELTFRQVYDRRRRENYCTASRN